MPTTSRRARSTLDAAQLQALQAHGVRGALGALDGRASRSAPARRSATSSSDEVIGKFELISYAVGIGLDGAVRAGRDPVLSREPRRRGAPAGVAAPVRRQDRGLAAARRRRHRQHQRRDAQLHAPHRRRAAHRRRGRAGATQGRPPRRSDDATAPAQPRADATALAAARPAAARHAGRDRRAPNRRDRRRCGRRSTPPSRGSPRSQAPSRASTPASDIGRFNAAPAGSAHRGRATTRPRRSRSRAALRDASGGALRRLARQRRRRLALRRPARCASSAPACALDLGGIGKGYAVDCGVAALVAPASPPAGSTPAATCACSARSTLPIDLRDERAAACTASRARATARSRPAGCVGGGALRHASVAAPRCIWADALTKIVARAATRRIRCWRDSPHSPGCTTSPRRQRCRREARPRARCTTIQTGRTRPSSQCTVETDMRPRSPP